MLSLNSISVAISVFLGIISTKIVSVFLGTSGMVLLGNFRNFSNMLKSIATLGISNSAIKLFAENKEDNKELSIIYSTFFWIFLFFSSLVAILVLLFSDSISNLLFFTKKYSFPIQLFSLFLPFMVINAFWLAIYNGLEKFKKIIIIQIISNLLIFVLTSILIWKQNIYGGLLAIALGELLMIVVTFIFVRKDKAYFRFDLKKVIDIKYLDTLKKFSIMSLLSALLAPLTLLFIRNLIVAEYSIEESGIWEAVNRLSGFYMLLFSSGLSLYYMPKLASINTDAEFKKELIQYFKLFVPLFFLAISVIFILREFILEIAFTKDFTIIKSILIWQLLGDFVKIISLAFGYQILAKTMIRRYFVIEIVFNLSYLMFSFYLMKYFSVKGVLQAYFYANVTTLIIMLWMFRNLRLKKKEQK